MAINPKNNQKRLKLGKLRKKSVIFKEDLRSINVNQNITNSVFQKSIKHHYTVLKKGYLLEVEKASNKEYAKQHFQNVLFLDNEFIPNQSILFDGLKTAFNHFSKLNPNTAFKNTLKLIPDYKSIANKHKENTFNYLNGGTSIQLSEHYLYYLNSNQFTLKELIQTETLVLNSSLENLMASLSLYVAGQQLYKEFNVPIQVDNKTKIEPIYQYSFTQKQQVLALYFIMKAYGINTKIDSDMTTLSALYHLILGVPFKSFDKLKNTNIYKNIRSVPNIFKSDSVYLKNLKIIRPYFVNISLIKVVELIDIQMNRCETK